MGTLNAFLLIFSCLLEFICTANHGLKSNLVHLNDHFQSASDFSQVYYVSNDGSDSNNGTIDNPFATLIGARNAIRKLKTLNIKTTSNNLPGAGGILVYIREGEYFNSLSMDNSDPLFSYNAPLLPLYIEDSGDSQASPIVYSGYPNEKVILRGSVELNSRYFRNSSINPNYLVLNLTEMNPLFKSLDINLGSIENGKLGECVGIRSELFVNDKRMWLARWPNMYPSNVEPGLDLWNWTHIKNVINSNTTFEYNFSDTRAIAWSKEISNAWVHGFWGFDWADNYCKIIKMDLDNHLIMVNESTPPVYGFHNNARYIGINILYELDTIDEYYIDRVNKLIYISKLRADRLESDKYYLSINPNIIVSTNSYNSTTTRSMSSSSDIDAVSYISIENVTIMHASDTAISFENVNNVSVSNVNVTNIGHHGVLLTGYNNLAFNNTIKNTGCTAMTVEGGDEVTLTRGNNFAVSNNVSYHALWQRTYNAAISFGGVGNSYINNFVGFGPHIGMTGSGNDHLFQYNKFYRLCFETCDIGAWYTGRSWTKRGSIIDSNIFENIYQLETIVLGTNRVHGIHLDDQQSGINITNNKFIQCKDGILIGGGRRNIVLNNQFAKCENDIYFDDRGLTSQNEQTLCKVNGTFNQELIVVNYTNPPYSVRYPYLPNIMQQEPCTPVFNYFVGNEYCCNNKSNIFGECTFIIQTTQSIQSWNSTIYGNVENNWNDDYCEM